MNELMLEEIRSQPAMLRNALGDLREQASRIVVPQEIDHVVLTGSGDSGYAAMAAEDLYLGRLKVPVWAVPSMTAARYPRSFERGVTIPASVSGEVIRTIESAHTAKASGSSVFGIVANGASTLAARCDAVLVMPKPITRATPHTRDYTATLLALGVLGERLSGKPWPDLDTWVHAVGDLVDMSLTWSEQIAVPGLQTRVWFLGSGPDRGTAAYAALKFWEAGGELSWWDDLEEFAHGSQLQARPGDDVFVFATGRARSRALEMIPGLSRMDLRVFVITDGPEVADVPNNQQFRIVEPPDLALIGFYSCVPVQAITYAYASARKVDVTVPMNGAAFGQTYEDVHNEWMRQSRLETHNAI